jgi:hypothetical protein
LATQPIERGSAHVHGRCERSVITERSRCDRHPSSSNSINHGRPARADRSKTMTITIPHPRFRQHSLVPYIAAVALAAFIAFLAYVALVDTSTRLEPIGVRISPVEPVFTDEWLAAQAAVGAQTPSATVFTDEWLAAQAAIGVMPVPNIITEEWLAAHPGGPIARHTHLREQIAKPAAPAGGVGAPRANGERRCADWLESG